MSKFVFGPFCGSGWDPQFEGPWQLYARARLHLDHEKLMGSSLPKINKNERKIGWSRLASWLHLCSLCVSLCLPTPPRDVRDCKSQDTSRSGGKSDRRSWSGDHGPALSPNSRKLLFGRRSNKTQRAATPSLAPCGVLGSSVRGDAQSGFSFFYLRSARCCHLGMPHELISPLS